MKRIKRFTCLLFALCLLLTGCGSDIQVAEIKPLGENENRQERLSMLEEPATDYEVEKMLPSIIVSLEGYEVDNDKVAIIENTQFPANFKLVEVESDREVYTGNIETRECSEDGELLSAIADFSDFNTEGHYYIKTDMLGRSKDFFISKIDRKDRVVNVLKTIHSYQSTTKQGALQVDSSSDVYVEADGGWLTDKDGGKDLISGCLTVIDLLLAYELHPDVFTDDFGFTVSGNGVSDLVDEIKFEVEWLKKMQNPETGGAYSGVYLPEDQSRFLIGGETTRATAYFCATMAKVSFDLAKVDWNYSNECLQAATKAYNCLAANKEIVTNEQMFRAAVEMYKVTGQGVYLGVINNFLNGNTSLDYESRAMLDAAMTYMSTSRTVNVQFCTQLMNHFMERTEEKSNAALASRFFVEPEKEVDVLLRNATELITADNIISNQEYEDIETNYLLYLSGRNHQGTDYTKTLDNLNQYAQLLVLVTELADKKR